MKNLLRPIFVVTFAALLPLIASIPADAAPRVGGRNAYDGSWSVVFYTLRGDCGASYRAAVRIYGGRVYAEDQSYQAYGAVGADGAVRATVVQGGQAASGAGRLRGNGGRGWWRTASGQCSGQWTAERRFANY
jgi:hypothetical protein